MKINSMKKLPLMLNLSTYLLGRENAFIDLCGYNTKIVNAVNNLSFDIIRGQLNNSSTEINKNLIFSPISVLLMISMLNYGTGDHNTKARSDLLGKLNLSSYRHNLHQLTGSLLKNLTKTINQIENTEFDLLTILQFAKYLELSYSMETELSSNYDALIKRYDFFKKEERSRSLNETYRLIRQHTKNQLNLFNFKYLPKESSRLNAYSTLHLVSNWLDPFNSMHTYRDKFYNQNGKSSQVLFMSRNTYVNTNSLINRDLQFLEIPFVDGQLSLIIITSSQRYALHEMLFHATNEELNSAINNLNQKYANIRIPRFIVEQQTTIEDLLKPFKINVALDCKQNSLQRFSKRNRTCLDFNLLFTKMSINEQGLNVINEESGYYGQVKIDSIAPKSFVNSQFAFIVRDKSGVFLLAGLINHL